MGILNHLNTLILDGQYGHPKGIVGYMLGQQMARQHIIETEWTLSLLKLQPEDAVLELGFGAGQAIEEVATQVTHGHITGIDISHTMVRSARHRNARAIQAGRVTLAQGDLMELPFGDCQFDNVFSIQTLYFWQDIPGVLAEIYRVLKPEGSLVITLSTGKIIVGKAPGLENYQTLLEEHVIPAMNRIGFASASIEQGPISRNFKTTAVLGVK